jgi:ferredoxin
MINIIEIIDSIKVGTVVVEISNGIYQATSDKSNYIIEYDKNKCIGAASCAAIAPLTFFMNDSNIAEINLGEAVKIVQEHDYMYSNTHVFDEDEDILMGAQSCPVLAIKIIDKQTGEIVFPIE